MKEKYGEERVKITKLREENMIIYENHHQMKGRKKKQDKGFKILTVILSEKKK